MKRLALVAVLLAACAPAAQPLEPQPADSLDRIKPVDLHGQPLSREIANTETWNTATTTAFLVWKQEQNAAAARRRAAAAVPSEGAGTKSPSDGTVSSGIWDRLAQCESGGRWSLNVGAHDGGLQFAPSTWRAFGGTQYAAEAWQASRAEQIAVAERVLAAQGWGAWPVCSKRIGVA